MILDSITEKITLILAGATTTNPGDCDANWTTSDPAAVLPTPTFGAGSNSPQTNGTTSVDLVPVPTTSTMRTSVQSLSVVNADTAPMTVTIRKTDTVGPTNRRVFGPVTILPNEKIQYTREEGWRVFDASGAIRSSAPLATVTSIKNLIINGAFRINQRGFAGGALAASIYGYDRWKAGAGGCNVTVNPTTFVMTHTSGPLVQIIEAPRLAGEVVTVSVANPSGSVSVNVDGQLGTITAGTGRRSATVTVPIGSTGNVTLTLTATGVTYSDVQLERGPFATVFEIHPPALDLAAAQRYYEKSYNVSVAPASITQVGALINFVAGLPNAIYTSGAPCIFSVGKRATPAVTIYSPATGTVARMRDAANVADVVATTDAIGEHGFFAFAAASASNTAFNMQYHFTADAEL